MDPREIVAEIYRQIISLQNQGNQPSRVLMDVKSFRLLAWYSSFLGQIEGSSADYLQIEDYRIFGIPIFAGNPRTDIRVE